MEYDLSGLTNEQIKSAYKNLGTDRSPMRDALMNEAKRRFLGELIAENEATKSWFDKFVIHANP